MLFSGGGNMLEVFLLTYVVAGIGALFKGARWAKLPSNHPDKVSFRKKQWLADHPNERWKCPYK